MFGQNDNNNNLFGTFGVVSNCLWLNDYYEHIAFSRVLYDRTKAISFAFYWKKPLLLIIECSKNAEICVLGKNTWNSFNTNNNSPYKNEHCNVWRFYHGVFNHNNSHIRMSMVIWRLVSRYFKPLNTIIKNTYKIFANTLE